jgi:predicted nucleotidyltransferase
MLRLKPLTSSVATVSKLLRRETERIWRVWAILRGRALEALTGQPVDLVVASAIKNPYFRQAVERTKTLLYAA